MTIARCRGLANQETGEQGRHQPASRAVVVLCCQWNCGWGLLIATCGKVDKLSLDCCLTILLCLCVIVSLQRDGERCVHGEGGTWYAITIRCPGAEVGHLTSLRTERAPGVAFPGVGLVAEGTDHARHCTMMNARNGQRLTRADLGRSGELQQTMQAALIDL
jgi:hypothetical protein